MNDRPFTLEEIREAADALRRANVPAFEGYYVAHVDPVQGQRLVLWILTEGRSYRVRRSAEAIFEHQCRRWLLGRRGGLGVPTARECFDRALRLEEAAR